MKHVLALPVVAALAAFSSFFAAPATAEAAPSCLTSKLAHKSVFFLAYNNCTYDIRIQYKSLGGSMENIVVNAGGDFTFIFASLGTPLATCNVTANRNCKPTLAGDTAPAAPPTPGNAQAGTRTENCLDRRDAHGNVFLVNKCGYTVRGNYRTDTGKTGGFGLIRPGREEIIAVKPSDNLNLRWCNDDAQKGCAPGKP